MYTLCLQTVPPPSPAVGEGDATTSIAEERPRSPSPNPNNPNEVSGSTERAALESPTQRSPSPIALRVEMPNVAHTPSTVEKPLPKATTVPETQPEVVKATPKTSFQPIFQKPPATPVDPPADEQDASDASPSSPPSKGDSLSENLWRF